MKRSLVVFGCLLTALIFFTLNASVEAAGMSSDEADSIKLKMLSYTKTGVTVDDLENGENVQLDVIVDGFRADSGNYIQRGPAGGKNTETTPQTIPSPPTYPVKCQFLVVAQVPPSANNVCWNISGADADIIGMPKASQFLDGTHVITPVQKTGSTSVSIENTHYAIISSGGKIELSDNWESKLGTKSSMIYDLPSGTGIERKEYEKGFTIKKNETYIILTASELGQTSIIASCMGATDPREATVNASVKWVEQPKAVRGGKDEASYRFIANIGDVVDPILLDESAGEKAVQLVIEVTNTGSTAIPKDLLVFRIFPDKRRGWWEKPPLIRDFPRREDSYCFKWTDLDKDKSELKIPSRQMRQVKINPRQINANIIPASTTEIENTELYFVGPISSGNRNGRGVQTNETTTVRTGDRPTGISGLLSWFSGSKVILKNQTIFSLWIDSINKKTSGKDIGELSGGDRIHFDASGTVVIEFHVVDKGNEIKGSVTLRQ